MSEDLQLTANLAPMTDGSSRTCIDQPIIIALDYGSAAQALDFVAQVTPALCKLKVGKELFTRAGPQLVAQLVNAGFDVFLDLKFHDIPATTAQAVLAAADLGVWMVNVHASGGSRMMAAAKQVLDRHRGHTRLVAVTVLTSFTEDDLFEILGRGDLATQTRRLATLARDCGLDGVVCSAHEAALLRHACGTDFLRVTPGIRIPGQAVSLDDQRRASSPEQALNAGSNYLVIGRPVTGADDPLASLLAVHRQIKQYYDVEQTPHKSF